MANSKEVFKYFGLNVDENRARAEAQAMQNAACPTEAPVTYGHPMFYEIVNEIRDLHERKNKQYATQDDPLGNFRRTGNIIAKMLKPGLDPKLSSCLAFMSKQVDGVYEMFGEAKTDTPDQLEDKLLDIAVYSIIAMIIIREARRQEKDAELYDTATAFGTFPKQGYSCNW